MSINDIVESLAYELGFKGVYFVSCSQDCSVLLVYPYTPFEEDSYVPAYYLASNKSYHAMQTLLSRLFDHNISAKNAHVLLKQAAQEARIGLMGKNTLLHMNDYGTRIVLYALDVKGIQPVEYDLVPRDLCTNCRICMTACPTGAITDVGYVREKCMRNHMAEPPYPSFVKENIKTYLGCEVCMQVCPYNATLKKSPVPQAAIDALAPSRILTGDVSAAKEYVGKNTRTSRLVADAEAILKSRGGSNA